MQPQALHGGNDRLAIQRVIDAVPVVGRQASDVGQASQVDLLVEVIVDVGRDRPSRSS
jgi:hypothetical protein